MFPIFSQLTYYLHVFSNMDEFLLHGIDLKVEAFAVTGLERDTWPPCPGWTRLRGAVS